MNEKTERRKNFTNLHNIENGEEITELYLRNDKI